MEYLGAPNHDRPRCRSWFGKRLLTANPLRTPRRVGLSAAVVIIIELVGTTESCRRHNRYYERSRISEHKFRLLVRYCALDCSASDTAELTSLTQVSRRGLSICTCRIAYDALTVNQRI